MKVRELSNAQKSELYIQWLMEDCPSKDVNKFYESELEQFYDYYSDAEFTNYDFYYK